MPPRDPALPEGTDHIIQGAAQLDGGAGGGGTGGATGGGSSSGFVAGGGGGDDTGGTAAGGGGGALAATGGGGGGGGGTSSSNGGGSGGVERIRTQVRDQVQSLKDQATDKARQLADDGKDRATDMLDGLGGVITDAARAIDERLGSEYSGYAHRAAGAVTNFAGSLRNKELEDLLDDTRAAIRRSPGIAIGIAAIAGFALVRVLKTGLEDVSGANEGSDGSARGSDGSARGGGSTGGTAGTRA